MNPLATVKSLSRRPIALYRRNDFEDVSVLGEGFFSEVLLVRHKKSSKCLVLKLPKITRPGNTREQNELARVSLIHESQILQRLNHPNVLRLFGQCVDGETPNMLLEYANGGTLEDLLANASITLDMWDRVSLAHNIADGVAYLHSNGVLHKDLSSKNILIRTQCVGECASSNDFARFSAVIADFGLAMCHKTSPHRRASLEGGIRLHDLLVKQRIFALERNNSTKARIQSVSDVNANGKDSTSDDDDYIKGNCITNSRAASATSLHSSSSISEGEKDLLTRSEYGSAWWKAPEQMIGCDISFTDRADVYSLGILLAEIVTRLSAVPDPGLLPRHDRRSGFALDFDKFREHSEVPVDTPEPLLTLIGSCCQVEPARRPSARSAEATLKKVLAHLMLRTDFSSSVVAISNAETVDVISTLTSCVSEATLRKCKCHRVASKAKSFISQPSHPHETTKLERDFYRAMRTIIPERSAALESLKLRRRSVSLSNVHVEIETDASIEV